MNEEMLLHGYRNVRPEPPAPAPLRFRLGRLEYRRCPCGSYLGLDHSRPAECQALVESHETAARHRAWSREVYLRALIGSEL
jgi:hypothetical protein